MQDDEMLSIQGGTNDWVIYIAIIFIVAVFFNWYFCSRIKFIMILSYYPLLLKVDNNDIK